MKVYMTAKKDTKIKRPTKKVVVPKLKRATKEEVKKVSKKTIARYSDLLKRLAKR